MTELTRQIIKENTSQLMPPTRIGRYTDLITFLNKLGITTLEQLHDSQEDCLVIERRGNIYWNNSQC